MIRKHSSTLALSMLMLGQLACGTRVVRAGDLDLRSTVSTDSDSKSVATGTDSKASADTDEGNFSRRRFHFTFDSRVGYDDNTLAQPDTVTFVNAAGATVRRNVNTSDSAFLNFDLGATYLAVNSRSTLSLGADVGVSYYFDRPGRNYDVNGGLTGRFAYKLAPRFFLEASTYNAYISQGDYGASNLTNFNGSAIGGVRAPGTSDNRNGDYFYTSDSVQVSFQATTRISLVTGYAITAFAYDDNPYSRIDDRVEQYFSEEFRFLLRPNLTLAADYRFGYVTYISINNDSYTHFLLGGFDYLFNPRLRASLRAGVEFRNYPDEVGDETSPYAEATITYDLSRRANFSLTARYGIEEGGLVAAATNSNTFRIGLSYNQQVTARISGYASFYYTHSYLQTPSGAVADFNEDTYDVAVGARYAITRNLSAELGYTFTTVSSQIDVREYERNRVFGGIRLAF